MSREQQVDEQVEHYGDVLRALARKIHDHPELRYQEHQAVAFIGEVLEGASVVMERSAGGLATAFRAVAGRRGGPRVAILAEYDALPEIGHACGHNLIAAGAVGAFLGLKSMAAELPGQVELIGTPAEEGGGGKIKLIEAGLFEGLDAAIMYHPLDRDILLHPALASVWLEMTYRGRPSHAAAAPWDGQSALTACLDTFRLIDGQRIHFRDGVRVHGFIKNGGQAVNIVPERAVAEFSVRALDTREMERVRAVVERCARGAALASGVEVEIAVRQGYRDMRHNIPLAERFGRHLEALGRHPRREAPEVGAGSTDMGDVSHVVPAIHPWLAICDEGSTTIHQQAFAASARSDRGLDTMIVAAKAMARTALDVLWDEELRRQIRASFETSQREGSMVP
ncbi:MAG: M20 family metallopeptidase [Myxococcales bacterium]|nr:M20 family metallopeptidase [Polyangiaceae bacterium]MDW8251497.1 M20 family metallopeptidase [Myxococcales bacterium]